MPDTDRWTLSMWEVNTAGCWVIIWCCSHFYYSYSVFLLGLTNNSQRFFAADGRFNCHPLLVYESSYGSILVSSYNWRNLVSEPDQGKQGNSEILTQDTTQDCSAQSDSIETTPLNGLSSIHWLDFHLVTCVSYNIHTKTKELFIVYDLQHSYEGGAVTVFFPTPRVKEADFLSSLPLEKYFTIWDVWETAGRAAVR